MTIFRILRRNLVYFRGIDLAVAAGVAVATAVLSGAMMVGDSVNQSLVDLANQRLGKVDQILIAPGFFDQSLARRLAADPAIAGKFEFNPAILLRGSAATDGPNGSAAAVQIIADANWVHPAPGQCVLSGISADALDVDASGAGVVLNLPRQPEMPPDAALARRARQDTLAGLRLRIASINRQSGMVSLFSPAGSQRSEQNVWANLADVQQAIDQKNRVDVLMVHDLLPMDAAQATQALNAALARAIDLDDYGLSFRPTSEPALAALVSRRVYLDPQVEAAAGAVARQIPDIVPQSISVHLLNSVNRLGGDNQVLSSIYYAVGAGISPMPGRTALADDEVAINAWAANALAAKVGDRLDFTLYIRDSDGQLRTTSAGPFRVARILPMSGIGADPTLTPTFKGMTDADSIADWNPPAGIEIDKALISAADEKYWKKFRAAPKVFISYAASQQVWGQWFGNATSIRIPAAQAPAFAAALRRRLEPARMGMAFMPLRQEQLAAAGGSVDFGQLFISFSFFLIVAAALLAAMLMRLGVEQRARQLASLAALGFSPGRLRLLMLMEGMTLSIAGGILGTPIAVAYTGVLIVLLRTWWIGAVGTSALSLHANAQTLAIGFVSAQCIAFAAIAWAVWRVGRTPAARLLAGGWEAARADQDSAHPGGRIALALALLLSIGAAAAIVAGSLGKIGQTEAFLGGGTCLLIGSLCGFWASLARKQHGTARTAARLAIRNAARHRSRSVLCAALIALAAFSLLTVASMRASAPNDTFDKHSGSGGFNLVLQTQIPLLADPGSPAGRAALGFGNPDDPLWDRVKFIALRRKSGQDVSCLNLTRPTRPTILAVPRALIDRGGFAFASRISGSSDNPWELLQTAPDNPIFADDNTAQYILHLDLGQTLDITDSAGTTRPLRLAATLAGSIFQSQLLISQSNFRVLFPDENGFGMVLIATDPADQDAVRRQLATDLSDYGDDVRTSSAILAQYLEVQNTYLSTFALLGALGLLLGVLGLAVVLIRTVIERRAELALLAAVGFDSGKRMAIVLLENAYLLSVGLLIGTLCALVGILPALVASARQINFVFVAAALAGAWLLGIGASALAVYLAASRVNPAILAAE